MNVTLHVSGAVSAFHHALIEHANANARPMRLVVPGDASRTERVGPHAVVYRVKMLRKEFLNIVRAEQPALIEMSDAYALLPGVRLKSLAGGAKLPVLVASSHEGTTDKAPFLGRLFSRVFLTPDVNILPMGVDARAFTPSLRTPEARRALAERVSVPACARLLLYVGKLGSETNVPMLVRMMDSLPAQYHLLLAGNGPLRRLLRHVGEQRRIRLIGDVQPSHISALYAGADAFLHADPRESFCAAPLKAMAAGLPLVTANAGGVLSYASPDNAWLAEPTPVAFADAVMQLWRAPLVEVRTRTELARSTAEQHDWPIMAARYFALFDQLIANKPCC
jgi:glycosyltransferase involved in cell wall biosynthesis